MSNKSDHIKLPCLRSIEVNGYPLFSSELSYKIKNGLNLFLGINGLGKTTTANIIIFGMVGEYEDINIKYFKSKIIEAVKPDPIISLKYAIGKTKIGLIRNLFSSNIVELSINNEVYDNEHNDINDYYERIVENFMGISINDLAFLLRYFLIREEEGNFLLWDQDSQSKVIRLLLNYPGFDSLFKEKSEVVRDYDSDVRDTQYFLKQLNDVLGKIESSDSQRNKLSDLQGDCQKNEEHIKTLRVEVDDLANKLSYMRKIKSDKEAEQDNMEAELEYLYDKVKALEEDLFGFIYTSPKVNLASDKLKRFNICMFCDSKINSDSSKKIVNIIEINKHCPVCDSGLRRAHQKDGISENKAIEDLTSLRSTITELEKRRSPLSNELESVSKDISSLIEKYNSLNIQVSQALSYNEEIKIKLSSLRGEKYSLGDIPSIKNKIDEIEKKIETAKKERAKYSKKLEKLNDELNAEIKSFEVKLNSIFTKYVSKYFTDECELESLEGKQSQEYRVSFTTFVPRLRQKTRKTIRTLSTYERIFLESIFRLSLVELYFSLTSNKPFILIETSDGSLDVVSVENYGKALNEFSIKNKFPFISISNLNETDFLPNLISGYDDINGRTLRFLEFGKLNKEQEKNRDRFVAIQNKLLGLSE